MVITAQDAKLKPGYKQTEIGVIPEDWEVKQVGELANKFFNGGTPSTQKSEYWSGNIPWITGADIVNQRIDVIRRYITKEAVKNSATNVIEAGNLLLVTRTGVGKMTIAPFDVAISQDITGIYVNDKIDVEYLFRFFDFHSSKLKELNQGTSIAGITRETLMTTLVAYPLTKSEQTAIATALSDTDSLIKLLDKLIAKKRDIKQATMQQLLTGKMLLPGFAGDGSAKLGDFFELNPNKPYFNDTDLVTFIRMEDVSESGSIINQNIMPLSSIKKGLTYFERNDVLVAKITPCFENGKGACLDTLETKSGFGSTEFHILRAKKNATPRYIFYQTQTVEFRQHLEAEMIGTAGQKRVPARAIIDYSLPVLHSIDEQRAIAAILSDMDAEIAVLEQKRDKTRALKQGMMQELLTGKTRLV